MKTKITIIICLLSQVVFSQNIVKSSIDNGGAKANTTGISMIYTIGEVNVQEKTVGDIHVSEGFISPKLLTAPDNEPPVFLNIPVDLTVECDAVPQPISVTAEDNIDGTIPVIFSEEIINSSCTNTYTIIRTWTATDAAGNTASASQTIEVEDTKAPLIVGIPQEPIILSSAQGDCGNFVTYPEINATDNCAENIELSFEPASGSFFPPGTTIVNITATDACGNTTNTSFDVIITNDLPVIKSIEVSKTLVEIRNGINVSALYSDDNLESAILDWGDGNTSFGDIGEGEITGEHTYNTAGIYNITLTIIDKCGETASLVYKQIVVYDPDAGFVTGGGWIYSPPGAYIAKPEIEGKAVFGFVCKYKKRTSNLRGHSTFILRTGRLTFWSTSYDWLIIDGAKAIFEGNGKLNGKGSYKFMISVIDDNHKCSKPKDKFRIKIWNPADKTVIYDNESGLEQYADAITKIGGGSIVIHKRKGQHKTSVNEGELTNTNVFEFDELTMHLYPNPAKEKLNIEFTVAKSDDVVIKIHNANGTVIHTSCTKGNLKKEIDVSGFAPGLYIVTATINDKVVKKKVMIE